MQQKIWLVTGCSSGFGFEISKKILEQGDKLIATSRKIDGIKMWETAYPNNALVISMDVTNETEINNTIKIAEQKFGNIDVLVNNAGYGLVGALEEVSADELLQIFQTNVFGLMNVTRAVLPAMRKNGKGHIINFSSVSGFRGNMGLGAYNATKFSVEGLSEALAMEVQALGIYITIIEPGGFRTNWGGHSMAFAKHHITDYDNTSGMVKQFFKSGSMPQRAAGNPEKLAAAIVKIASMDTPPLRLALGTDSYSEISRKISEVAKNLEKWKDLTLSMGD